MNRLTRFQPFPTPEDRPRDVPLEIGLACFVVFCIGIFLAYWFGIGQ